MISFQNRISSYQIRESNKSNEAKRAIARTEKGDKHAQFLADRRRQKCDQICQLIRSTDGPVTTLQASKHVGIETKTLSHWICHRSEEMPFVYGPRLGNDRHGYYTLVLKAK